MVGSGEVEQERAQLYHCTVAEGVVEGVSMVHWTLVEDFMLKSNNTKEANLECASKSYI